MGNTPRLNMPEIASAQADKYITHNLALKNLDALVQLSVEDRAATSPSLSSADDGKCYIITATGGDWSTFSVHDIAQWYDNQWYNYVPEEGYLGYVKDEDKYVYFDGTSWVDLTELYNPRRIYIPATEMKLGGSRDPDWVQRNDNGSGSIGVFTYQFDPDAEEELFVNWFLPETYIDDTSIQITILWEPTTSDTDNNTIWGLEYMWQEQGLGINNTTIITKTDNIPLGASQNGIFRTISFDAITAVSKSAGSLLAMRIFRDATDSVDDYPGDGALLGIRIDF